MKNSNLHIIKLFKFKVTFRAYAVSWALTFYLQYENENVIYLNKSGLKKFTKFNFFLLFFF